MSAGRCRSADRNDLFRCFRERRERPHRRPVDEEEKAIHENSIEIPICPYKALCSKPPLRHYQPALRFPCAASCMGGGGPAVFRHRRRGWRGHYAHLAGLKRRLPDLPIRIRFANLDPIIVGVAAIGLPDAVGPERIFPNLASQVDEGYALFPQPFQGFVELRGRQAEMRRKRPIGRRFLAARDEVKSAGSVDPEPADGGTPGPVFDLWQPQHFRVEFDARGEIADRKRDVIQAKFSFHAGDPPSFGRAQYPLRTQWDSRRAAPPRCARGVRDVANATARRSTEPYLRDSRAAAEPGAYLRTVPDG